MISIDVLYETLKFLDRNEIEKCQLIDHSWNLPIQDEIYPLPKRKFHALFHSKPEENEYQWYIDPGNFTVTKEHIYSNNPPLRHVIFEKIMVDVEVKVAEKLAIMFQENGQKLEAIRAEFSFSPKWEKEEFLKRFQILHEILRHHVNVQEILLTVGPYPQDWNLSTNIPNLINLLQDPSLMNLQKIYDYIDLKIIDLPSYTPFTQTPCLCLNIVHFLMSHPHRNLRLDSHFHCMDYLEKAIVGSWLKCTNPDTAFRRVLFKLESPYAAIIFDDHLRNNWSEEFLREYGPHRRCRIEDEKGYSYRHEFERKDGWTLTVNIVDSKHAEFVVENC